MTNSDAPQLDPAAQRVSKALCPEKDRKYVLVAAILASALGFIDGTVVAIAMPAMRETLGATLAEAQWVHNAYMLTLTALILAGGALGDRFGIARIFRIGIGLFVLASMACAIAPNAVSLIFARALQGIGAAVMVPGSLAIISRAYPKETRARAIGLWAAASAMTTALGPIIGGLALTLGGPEMWRWIFAINLPLGGIALVLLWLPSYRAQIKSDAPIDYLGPLTIICSLFAIAWGLNAQGHSNASPSWAWLMAGGIGIIVFLFVERYARAPMMPLRIFSSRVFASANLMSFAIYAALSIMFFFLPMTVISTWDVSEIDAAAAFAPLSIFIAALSGIASKWSERIGHAPVLAIGSLFVASGLAALALLAPEQNYWGHVLPSMCAVGIGMGIVVAPLSNTVMSAASEDLAGAASGINNAVSRLASLVGVAAVGGLVATMYRTAGGPAEFGVSSTLAGHHVATTAAFQGILAIAATLCVISAILAAFTSVEKRPATN